MSPIPTVLLLAAMLFTSDGLKFASTPHRSADDQAIPHRSAEEQINRHRSVNGRKISQYRSAPDNHICSPNPCGPASICLICDVHNCPNPMAKNHFCLCWRNQMWKNCDEAELETSNSSGKVRVNSCDYAIPCQYGKCLPKSVYPGYECRCDEHHTGEKCDKNKYWELGWNIGFGVFFGLILIFVVIIICCDWKKKPDGTDQQLKSNGVEKSQKTSAPPPTPTKSTVECQTETSPSSSAKVTPKGSQPTKTEESPV